VDKRVERLSQKHHKTLTSTQRIMERKVGALEKKREQYVRKLQSAEKRKEALQERRERIRRKKISSKTTRGFYELDSCEREINNIKKDVKSFSDAIDKVKKEGINNVKRIEVEFSKAVANEEEKIINLNATFEVKINDKKQQIAEITKQVTAITNDFENIKDELEHSSSILRHQIEIGCKLDTPEKPLCCFLPIYMVKYVKASEERYAMFSPITISEDVSVLNGLRKIITFSSEPKFKALTRSVSKRLQDMLTFNVVDRMQSDVEFRSRVNSLCRANNLLDTMEFAETLNSGLDEFIKRNWITSEEAVSLCKRIMGEGV